MQQRRFERCAQHGGVGRRAIGRRLGGGIGSCFDGAVGCGGHIREPGPAVIPGDADLVIWADDKRAAALKPLADQYGQSENGVKVRSRRSPRTSSRSS